MKKSLIGLALLGFATNSFAHTGHGVGQLLAAFAHPFTGLDHLTVFLAMGFFIGQRAQLRISQLVGMLTLLAFGMFWGQQGLYAPMMETAIACSVIVLGVVSFKRWMPDQGVLSGLMGATAVLHGLAHGVLLQSLPLATALSTSAMMLLGALVIALLGIALANNVLVKRVAIQQWLAAAMLLLGGSLILST